ncbi:MAG: glycine--tRNA ligase subunit beta, partial [Elusimicrobia bacterium]|nr:glycine--tRNA ligase subunit beta [Elusimicrobiota bacterium]
MLAAGFKPSGSEDPFALRRLGNGAVRIVLERQLAVDLEEAAERAVALVRERGAEVPIDPAAAKAELVEFLWQRVETLLLEKGYKADELRAVKAGGLRNLARTFLRLAAVHALRPDPDFVPVAAAFKRASNILRQAGVDFGGDGAVDSQLLADPAEQALFGAVCRVEGQVKELVAESDFEPALRALVALKPDVDLFFDKVMVMVEDESVKRNRLALLARLARLFTSVADLSAIQ